MASFDLPSLPCAGAFQTRNITSFDGAYTALLFCSLGVLTWLYHTLYSSDPGGPNADSLSSSAAQGPPCEHCNVASPTPRVRHDFATGALCKVDLLCHQFMGLSELLAFIILLKADSQSLARPSNV